MEPEPSAPGEEPAVPAALANVVGYLLRRANNVFQTYWMANFRGVSAPITPVQAGMLLVLEQNPGLTQTALARMMNVEGPTLLQSIDRLEEYGFVKRLRRPADRRSYSLQLTPEGVDVVKAVQAFGPARDDELMATLSAEERRVLIGLLTRVIADAPARGQSGSGAAARRGARSVRLASGARRG